MNFLKLFPLSFLLFFSNSLWAKTFIYCSEGSPIAFNPQITTDGTSNNAAAHTIYNRLVEFEYGSTQIIPALAERYTISEDQKTYDFYLRKDVFFHETTYFKPGRAFNADDVLFSFMRMHDSSHPFHSIGGGQYEYYKGMGMGELIKSITKINDHHVRITLNRPEAPFLANMAMSFMSILSEEYGSQLLSKNKASEIDHSPIGTGPFVFRRYNRDSQIRYLRHPHFWGGKVAIEQLVFAITPEASVRYQKLRSGECHLIIEPAPSDLAQMKNDSKLRVLQGSGFNIGYLAMNTQKKPFDNKYVRQAMNYALNRQAYIDAIYLGNAQQAKNPIPPTLWAYDDQISHYHYNPQKARELLTKAGFPDGFETELWTLPVTRPYNPAGRRMGEMMQADLAQVGIRVRLVSYDWGTYLSRSRAGEHPLIQLGWTGDNGDPDNFFHTLLGCEGVEGGSNVAKWCHKEFNDQVMQAKRLSDQAKRRALYIRAQEIFREEAPWVPIAHSTLFRAMSNKVKGYQLDPLGGDNFRFVDLE